MKRLVSFVLVCIMAVSLFPIKAAARSTFFLSETFENYATYAKPDTGQFSGSLTVVSVRGDKDKMLELTGVKKRATAQYPINAGETEISISFDIKADNGTSGSLAVLNAGNAATTVMTLDEGALKLSDGKYIGGIDSNRYTNIRMKFDGFYVTIDINGKTALYRWYMQTGLPKMFSSLLFSFENRDADMYTVCLDNLYAYTGAPAQSEFSKRNYNADQVEKPDIIELLKPKEIEVGNCVFTDKSFDDPEITRAAGLKLSAKSNTLRFITDKKSGNTYLEFLKNGTEDALIDINVGTQNTHVTQYIFECDMKKTGANPPVDINAGGKRSISISNGGVITVDSTVVGTINETNWTHLALHFDCVTGTLQVYVDGKLDEQKFDADIGEYITAWRIYFRNSGSGSVSFDNLRIYEGDKPKTDIYAETEAAVGDSTDNSANVLDIIRIEEHAKEALGDSIAVSAAVGTYYNGKEKRTLEHMPFTSNGSLYVPILEMAEAFGITVDYNQSAERVDINGKYRYTSGDEFYEADGNQISGQPLPIITNGILYFPVRFLGETILNQKVTWNDKEFVVIGDSEFKEEVGYTYKGSGSLDRIYTNAWDISDYLIHDMVNARVINDAFEAQGNTMRPRIFVTPSDIEDMKEKYQSDELYQEWVDTQVIDVADDLVEKDSPTVAMLSAGGMLLNTARQILSRMQTLGLAYFITGDTKYPEYAYRELQSVGAIENWEKQVLDISEFMAAYSIAYDWFYDYWTEEQRAFIENCVMEKAFNSIYDCYFDTAVNKAEFCGSNNRGLVVAVGTLMTALTFYEKDPDKYSELIWRLIWGIHVPSRMWWPDGAWVEGSAYWGYTLQYTSYGVSALQSALGTDFGILNTLGLDKAPELCKTYNMSVGGFNIGDRGDEGVTASHLVTWIAHQYENEDYYVLRRWMMDKYNSPPDFWDILLMDLDVPYQFEAVTFPTVQYMRDVEVVTMRQGYEKGSTCVSVEGGYGLKPHGHYDAGTFCLDMLGERFVSDYGSESYGVAGNQTELIYRMRAEGHNCLVINPDETPGIEPDSFSPIEKLVESEKNPFTVINLTEAYRSHVASARRGFMLGNDRRSLTVRDELILKEFSDVYWFIQTKASVEKINNSTVILTRGQQKVKVEFLSSAKNAAFEVMAAEVLPSTPATLTQQTVNTGATRLAIHFKDIGKQYLEVRFIPVSDPAAESDMLDTSIDRWAAEPGSIQPMPKLTSLSVDGADIADFESGRYSYLVLVDDTAAAMPKVSAACEDGSRIEITDAEGFHDNATVKVVSKNDEYSFSVYTVKFIKRPAMPNLDALERLEIKKLIASDEPQKENRKENVLDGSFETRWAAQNECYLQFELTGVKKLSKVAIATLDGQNKRSTTFKIEVSKNGSDWIAVYESQTTGTTDELEYYDIGGVDARYVRVNFYGTTTGNWNSVTEVGIFANK